MAGSRKPLDIPVLKVSRCACTSIYYRSWTPCPLIHAQVPAHRKRRGSIAGIWDKAVVVFLPSSSFTVRCPHLQVVSCPCQSQGVGIKENMEKKREGNCCAQIPASVLTSGPISSQADFSSFQELGIGGAEVLLADMIKNLPSKEAT